ncbi:DNA polymerase III subunit alpha [Fusobacterium sp. MFO224]|uniref:DNA polymerase III subunit alpha n=1 Tax=Fusobacterium sp. MFO224 TaxID=3378070 RepID=UPI00385378DF
MENKFTHLHLHTEYSLLDGVGKISEYINRAKELKMKSIGITDHGNMFGAIEMYKKAIKNGIKPIIGIEAYIAENGMKNKEGRIFHIVLLAKNNEGYKNLIKISSEAYIEGFYYKPRIDKEFLKSHKEGVICLSACMQGEIPRRILDGESLEIVNKSVKDYIDIFGKEDFYIELQSNGFQVQRELNRKLYELAKRFGLKTVATNDTHYVNKGDHVLQDIMLCIQTGSRINDEKRMKIETEELYLKDREEMIKSLGKEYIEAIDNTSEISDKCNVQIEFGKFKFPYYVIPENEKNIENYLKTLVYEGLKKRYPLGLDESIIERVEYEISIINKMGYAGYFVVVWDFISFAKGRGIPIGPGRGSAAGSLVAYALGITELDPLKYNLIFERFLNPERISMPDIDIDICQERRQELIEYVIKKYGSDKVAQIITFGTLKARAAIRDVGRVLNIQLSKIDKIAKLIPSNYSINDALKNIKELNEMYRVDNEIKMVLDLSNRLENKVRHTSIHAAGIVITKDPLNETVPLYSDKDSATSTQYQMKELEELGLLKMDFLGLKNLTNIQRTIDYIKDVLNKEIKLEDIPLNNEKVYELFSRGDTLGIFQCESKGIRKILKKLKPDRFEDIIALLALYRPGPLGSGMVDNFINCKNGIEEIKYPHDSLKEILEETYGVILYQEQVMKIANIMANYSLGEADLLRRAMGKKNIYIMEENKEKFIERSIKNGYTEEKANEIFNLIDKFAGYGFNKSHSAAYALIAYWTAYLKALYPKYYFAAIMSSGMNDIENIAGYIEDAKKHQIKVKFPSVNKAASRFLVDKDGIIFALSAIKNLGIKVSEGIKQEAQENGEYKAFDEFIFRTKKYGINKKGLEALIYSGALDCLEGNRKAKIESISKAIDYTNKRLKEDEIQQMNLFGEAKSSITSFSMSQVEDFKLEEKLKKEKEFLGFYLSANPLDIYKNIISAYRADNIESIKDGEENKITDIVGILHNIKKVVTKKTGEIMGIFDIEDYTGIIQGIIFPRDFKKYFSDFVEGKVVLFSGSIKTDYFNGNETKKFIVKKLIDVDKLSFLSNKKVYLLLKENEKYKFLKLKDILRRYSGQSNVFFAMKKEGKKVVRDSNIKVFPSLNFINEVVDLLGKDSLVIK